MRRLAVGVVLAALGLVSAGLVARTDAVASVGGVLTGSVGPRFAPGRYLVRVTLTAAGATVRAAASGRIG